MTELDLEKAQGAYEGSEFQKLLASFEEPSDRLGRISKGLRRISKNLETGKNINPKKIKELAGSLDYWGNKMWMAGLSVIFKPVEVLKAYCEMTKAVSPPNEEPPPKPVSPEEKLLIEKYLKAFMCLDKIHKKARTGELAPGVFDSFIEKAEELAA